MSTERPPLAVANMTAFSRAIARKSRLPNSCLQAGCFLRKPPTAIGNLINFSRAGLAKVETAVSAFCGQQAQTDRAVATCFWKNRSQGPAPGAESWCALWLLVVRRACWAYWSWYHLSRLGLAGVIAGSEQS